MPFEPLTPEEREEWPRICQDPQHNPPPLISVLTEPIAWVCPTCGNRVILSPPFSGW